MDHAWLLRQISSLFAMASPPAEKRAKVAPEVLTEDEDGDLFHKHPGLYVISKDFGLDIGFVKQFTNENRFECSFFERVVQYDFFGQQDYTRVIYTRQKLISCTVGWLNRILQTAKRIVSSSPPSSGTTIFGHLSDDRLIRVVLTVLSMCTDEVPSELHTEIESAGEFPSVTNGFVRVGLIEKHRPDLFLTALLLIGNQAAIVMRHFLSEVESTVEDEVNKDKQTYITKVEDSCSVHFHDLMDLAHKIPGSAEDDLKKVARDAMSSIAMWKHELEEFECPIINQIVL